MESSLCFALRQIYLIRGEFLLRGGVLNLFEYRVMGISFCIKSTLKLKNKIQSRLAIIQGKPFSTKTNIFKVIFYNKFKNK